MAERQLLHRPPAFAYLAHDVRRPGGPRRRDDARAPLGVRRGPRAEPQIVVRSERLPVHLYAGWISKTPFLRGLTVLWDSLGLGMKALMFSAEVAEREDDEHERRRGSTPTPHGATAEPDPTQRGRRQRRATTFGQTLQWTTVAVAMLFGIGVFFLLPLGAAALLELAVENTLVVHLFEGLVRLGLLVGYVWAIGFVPEIRRVFAYHGAEHMTIHAFEAGEPLDQEHIGKYPPAHPRCGTAFLLLVVAISILLFALIPTDNWWVRIASRILSIPIIAGIAYEVLKLGGAPRRAPAGAPDRGAGAGAPGADDALPRAGHDRGGGRVVRDDAGAGDVERR